jgi:drug/metabolite transporter (DMT)-like permease
VARLEAAPRLRHAVSAVAIRTSTTGLKPNVSIRWLLLTLLCVVLIAAGQVLFKVAAAQWRIDGWSWSTLRAFLSPAMVLALIVYGATTVLWVFILRSVPLGSAFPVYALVFVLVPLAAHFALGEPWSWNAMIGAVVIMAGVFIAVR